MSHPLPITGSNPPHGPNTGPIGPLQHELRSMRTMLGLVVDDPETVIREVYTETLDLPPEKRFTESVELLQDTLLGEVEDIETAKALLPHDDGDGQRLGSIVAELCSQLVDSTLESVWRDRDAEVAIAIAAGFVAVQSGFEYFVNEPEIPTEDRDQILSSAISLFARLLSLEDIDSEQFDPEALLTDIGYAVYYIDEGIQGTSEFPNPGASESGTVRQELREFGAVIAYARLNISVGRGAELAGVSRFRFEEILEDHEISPRYGPFSVDELSQGRSVDG